MNAKEVQDAGRARLIAALAQVADGDRAALRALYDLTAAKLFGVCLRICQDREIAEDILQDVYLKVWNRAGRYDAAKASPITWLCAIARNTAVDWRRASAAPPMLPDDAAFEIADDRPLAPEMIEREQDCARVAHCLDALDERSRTAIRAAFFDGFTYAQLAERMKVPLGTMKSWVRRGLLQMKACLSDG